MSSSVAAEGTFPRSMAKVCPVGQATEGWVKKECQSGRMPIRGEWLAIRQENLREPEK